MLELGSLVSGLSFCSELHPQLAEHVFSAAICTFSPEIIFGRVLDTLVFASTVKSFGYVFVLCELGAENCFHNLNLFAIPIWIFVAGIGLVC